MIRNVLVLEDDPGKKGKLCEHLNAKLHVSCENIDFAICTADALKRLREKEYELFIADVIVPVHAGGEKSETNSMDLFQQIDDGEDLYRPLYSVALSESSELSISAQEFFKHRPWGIIKYSDNDDSFRKTIDAIIEFIGNGSKSSLSCDVFIITALDTPEFTELENAVSQWSEFEPLDECQLVRFINIETNAGVVRVGAGYAQRMGPVASSILTTKAILKLKPKLVLMCGICAGVKADMNFGDVIAAEVSWDWQSGKYTDEKGEESFEISPHQIDISDLVKAQLSLFKREEAFWNSLNQYSKEHSLPPPKLYIGPMATGSSVIADTRVTDRMKKNQHRNLTGLDMEVYGVYASVLSCDRSINFLSLKSVCDKGDKEKNDKYQKYASKISAKVTIEFIKKFAKALSLRI